MQQCAFKGLCKLELLIAYKNTSPHLLQCTLSMTIDSLVRAMHFYSYVLSNISVPMSLAGPGYCDAANQCCSASAAIKSIREHGEIQAGGGGFKVGHEAR
jgi:hypothetical protein